MSDMHRVLAVIGAGSILLTGEAALAASWLEAVPQGIAEPLEQAMQSRAFLGGLAAGAALVELVRFLLRRARLAYLAFLFVGGRLVRLGVVALLLGGIVYLF